MKKITNKLWIIVVLVFIGIGIYSLTHSMPVSLDEKEGNTFTFEETYTESSEGIFATVVQDFKKFIKIQADAIGSITHKEKSEFNSGWDVLRGKEDIEYAEASDISADSDSDSQITDNIDSDKHTIASVVNENKTDANKESLTTATLLRVVDGDTLYVDIEGYETKVRLIGIDTPESVHADESKNTEWGERASEFTKSLLTEGMTLYLEYDVDALDKYERTLAYVWMSDDLSSIDNMLNAKIVANGYAINKVYEPNVKYKDSFEQLAQNAKAKESGLWSIPDIVALWEK